MLRRTIELLERIYQNNPQITLALGNHVPEVERLIQAIKGDVQITLWSFII